jgi:hypothetical protein
VKSPGSKKEHTGKEYFAARSTQILGLRKTTATEASLAAEVVLPCVRDSWFELPRKMWGVVRLPRAAAHK